MSKLGEFKYGVNAIRAIIRATGKTPQEILIKKEALATDMEIGTVIIWAGMLWKKKTLTVDEVGDMLDAEEGLYIEALKEAFSAFVFAFNRMFVPAAVPAEDESGTEKN